MKSLQPFLLAALAAVFAGVLWTACSGAPACGPATCTGCCTLDGACQPGHESLSCGSAGAACQACAGGTNCLGGVCLFPSTQTGQDGGSDGGNTDAGDADAGEADGGDADGGLDLDGGSTGDAGTDAGTVLPNVMLVFDKSGSMNRPLDPAHPDCPSGCGFGSTPCPTACPTRLSLLKGHVTDLLATDGLRARFGLALFPSATANTQPCLPGMVALDIVQADDAPALAQQNEAIRARVDAIGMPGGDPVLGGGPIATTLEELAQLSSLQDPARPDAVLLITDGAPICNSELDPATCECSANPCQLPVQCIDRQRTLARITALVGAGVRVAVVGIGSDVTSAPHVDPLHEMALAGEAPALCGQAACSPAFHHQGPNPLRPALDALLR